MVRRRREERWLGEEGSKDDEVKKCGKMVKRRSEQR